MAENTELMTTTEVAEQLKICRDNVLKLFEDGHLRGLRLGPRTIRIFRKSVEQLIQDGGTE